MSRKRRSELWQEEPAEHDYVAAADYLSLLLPEQPVALVVEGLRTAGLSRHKAKDLMRSSRLALLPADDPEVAKELKRVAKGASLSPVLLVRGQLPSGVPLTIADGYHRICASYHLGEDASIPCRIADLP
jgi:hypothetical protein